MVQTRVNANARVTLKARLKKLSRNFEEWCFTPVYKTESKSFLGGRPPPPPDVNTEDNEHNWGKGAYFFSGLFILLWSLVFMYKDEGLGSDIFSGIMFWVGVSPMIQAFMPWPSDNEWRFAKRFMFETAVIFSLYSSLVLLRG